MRLFFLLLLQFILIISCSEPAQEVNTKNQETRYYNDLGDISYDPSLDKRSFVLCDSSKTMQGRSRLQYEGGKKALKKEVLKCFKPSPSFDSYSGFVTVRFMINCRNETGRYRVHSLNLDFNPQECPSELKELLVDISKGLKSWNKSKSYSQDAEYSKYINYKIKNGVIDEVLL